MMKLGNTRMLKAMVMANINYKQIVQVDEMYLMRPKSVPGFSLYEECGKLPVRFTIQSRRMM